MSTERRRIHRKPLRGNWYEGDGAHPGQRMRTFDFGLITFVKEGPVDDIGRPMQTDLGGPEGAAHLVVDLLCELHWRDPGAFVTVLAEVVNPELRQMTEAVRRAFVEYPTQLPPEDK